MKFLYLVQGNKKNIADFLNTNKGLDILSLTFDEPLNGSFFFPKSTWAQGRNALLQEAEKSNIAYDYYIFLDDDLCFTHGSFAVFENDMERIQPDVGVASMDIVAFLRGGIDITTKHSKNISTKIRNIISYYLKKLFISFLAFAYWIRRLDFFKNRPYRGSEDSCFIALKTSTLKETRVLPYHEHFDDENWNVASGIMHALVAIWRLKVYTSASVVVANTITQSVTGTFRVYPTKKLNLQEFTDYLSRYTSIEPQVYEKYYSRRLKLSYAKKKKHTIDILFIKGIKYYISLFFVILDFGNLFGKDKWYERAKNPMLDTFFIEQKKLSTKKYNIKKM